ncbi:hypothetical protein NL676_010239 [Syzygium grande]|nr:hypothetical protein NL676_010239 [Syzygium grande]
MAILTASPLVPAKLESPSLYQKQRSLFHYRRSTKKKNLSIVPVARLFGPAIFEASKLKVLFLGVDDKKHPGKLPRTYTLTHSDVTSKLTLAISQTINNSQLQGWYNRLQRDEVVAEWKKVKGKMSLHVHCHISGGHFLLDLFAKLRYFIFCKELPVVLGAFVHGDGDLLNQHPELQEALPGPARGEEVETEMPPTEWELPEACRAECECCFPLMSSIQWSEELPRQSGAGGYGAQEGAGQQS